MKDKSNLWHFFNGLKLKYKKHWRKAKWAIQDPNKSIDLIPIVVLTIMPFCIIVIIIAIIGFSITGNWLYTLPLLITLMSIAMFLSIWSIISLIRKTISYSQGVEAEKYVKAKYGDDYQL